MKDYERYAIDEQIRFGPLIVIDIDELQKTCKKEWQNLGLCRVNECAIRLAVIEGEFHWHTHDESDEFFYIVEGKLLVDLEDRTEALLPKQSIVIPAGVSHRTRATERTVIIAIEKHATVLTGD